ncbi:MAG: toprim domain-containing protein [Candidatus Pacebacteria bacterium]|nr:toprim domain-containing protein [Candidatus Paceibacterota bacterium]
MTNDAEKLATLFEKFPGIGPRQARRFVYFLLKSGEEYRGNLNLAISNLTDNIRQCAKCYRYYASGSDSECGICGNSARDSKQLLIVEKDADLDSVEKSGGYSGYYFVLGGGVKLTDSSGKVPNQERLLSHIKNTPELKEIILAMPTTTEGEHTAQTIINTIKTIIEDQEISVTMLGRGLSTGAELEYADSATLKSAIESRG